MRPGDSGQESTAAFQADLRHAEDGYYQSCRPNGVTALPALKAHENGRGINKTGVRDNSTVIGSMEWRVS